MKDKKLNNLLGIDEFKSVDKLGAKSKPTKRTGVAKDVLKEAAYVTGKKELKEKPKGKESHVVAKGLNNLVCLDDFTKEVPKTSAKATKRTSVAKDILNEKKAGKEKEECDDKEDKEESDKKSGLTAAQKKLPKSLQDAILKRQKNKK